MKILKVKGRNLASLESFEIDFEDPVFTRNSLFAICGKTGAGKSTILDAITLALYGKIARYEKVSATSVKKGRLLGSKSNEDQDNIKDEKKELISASNVKNIITRGKTNCSAIVEFKDNKGEIWTASWEVPTLHTETPKKQLKKCPLYDFNQKNSLKSEVYTTNIESHVTKLIGLNWQQFSKIILLPQGQFSDFIKGKTTDRAEILEKITGVDLYTKISAKVIDKQNKLEEQKKRIEDAIAMQNELILDDAVLEDYKTQVEDKKKQLQEISENIQHFKDSKKAYDQYNKSHDEYQKAQTKFIEAENELQNLKNSNSFTLVKNYEKFITKRSVLDTLKETENDVKQSDKSLTDLRKGYETNERNIQDVETELNAIQRAIDDFSAKSHERDQIITRAVQIETQIANRADELKKKTDSLKVNCQEMHSIEVQSEDLKKTIDNEDKDLIHVRNELKELKIYDGYSAQRQLTEKIIDDIKDVQKVIDEIQSKIADAEKKVNSHNNEINSLTTENENFETQKRKFEIEKNNFEEFLKTIISDSDNISSAELMNQATSVSIAEYSAKSSEINELQNLKTTYDECIRQSDKYEDYVKSSNENKNSILQLYESLNKLNAESEQNNEKLNSKRLELNNLDYQNQIAKLRKSFDFHEGAICPFCGSTHHQLENIHEDSVYDLDEIQKIIDELENNKNSFESEINKVKNNIDILNNENDQKNKIIEECKGWIRDKLQNINGIAVKYAELDNFRESNQDLYLTSSFWQVETTKLNESIKIAKVEQKKLLDKKEKISTAVKEINSINEELNELNGKINANSSKISTLKLQISENSPQKYTEELDRFVSSYEGARKNLFEILNKYLRDNLELSITNDQLFSDANKIAKNSELLKEKVDEESKINKQLEDHINQFKLLNEQIKPKKELINEIKLEIEKLNKDQIESNQTLSELLGGITVEQYKTEINNTDKDLKNKLAEATNKFNNVKTNRDLLNVSLKAEEKNFSSLMTKLKDQKENLEKVLCEFSVNRDIFESVIYTEETLINQYKNEITIADENCNNAKNSMDSKKSTVDSMFRNYQETLKELPQDALLDDKLVDEYPKQMKLLGDTLNEEKEKLESLINQDKNGREIQQRRQNEHDKLISENKALFDLGDLIGTGMKNKFNNFVQSITFDKLIKQANRYLSSIKARYSLRKVDSGANNNLDMLVVDHELGDTERHISHVSGGELFIISLAMALALSDITTKNVPLESLFIDEGFGTLDAETLDIVINTLKNIGNVCGQRRLIGIISHVEALKEQVGARVIVENIDGYESRSTVRVE